MNLVAQAVGVVGIVFSLLSFQQKERKNILLLQMAASLMFSTQLFMVGAITGGCLDLISFIRTLVFFNNNKKWAASNGWLYFFVAFMIFTGILTWQDGWSILPIVGAILSTTAFWMKKEKHIRIIALFVGPCWILYNVVTGAYTGALNELLAMTSIVIGLFRHDWKAPKEAK